MRGLSLTEPWATLVATGEKEWETRSWPTRYRGPVLIHASKLFPFWARELVAEYPFRTALRRHDIRTPEACTQHLGCVLAVGEIVDCRETRAVRVGPIEEAFGDWSPGRYGFQIANVRRLEHPVPWRGALGLWRVPEELETAIRKAGDA